MLLHDPGPEPYGDGAACLDGRLDGNKLTLWTSNQMIDWCRTDWQKR